MATSKTTIDRLGDRLRYGTPSEADVRLLESYRLSFAGAFTFVVETLKNALSIEVTGRPAKTTPSIVDKLRRERIRLSQMQDIAGCRLVVENVSAQNHVVELLATHFQDVDVIDRRVKTSHGYRAVHIIVHAYGLPVEIQVRTVLQQRWAELSEKASDAIDPSIKYGGGSPDTRRTLTNASNLIATIEGLEAGLETLPDQHASKTMSLAEVTRLREDYEETLKSFIEDIQSLE